ncbi:MAG: hypothetical protein D8H96_10505 [Lautropia sp.]|nr:MAG: hypothetical protein D8H96_10505 [Lautropia sp.]
MLLAVSVDDERVVTVLSTRSVLRAVLPSVFAWEASAASTDVNGAVPMQKNTSAQAAAYARPNAYDD